MPHFNFHWIWCGVRLWCLLSGIFAFDIANLTNRTQLQLPIECWTKKVRPCGQFSARVLLLLLLFGFIGDVVVVVVAGDTRTYIWLWFDNEICFVFLCFVSLRTNRRMLFISSRAHKHTYIATRSTYRYIFVQQSTYVLMYSDNMSKHFRCVTLCVRVAFRTISSVLRVCACWKLCVSLLLQNHLIHFLRIHIPFLSCCRKLLNSLFFLQAKRRKGKKKIFQFLVLLRLT